MSDTLREKLAAAGRILEREGQGDNIWGHVTARDPAVPERILMKPSTIGLEEMRPDQLITVDFDGKKIDGTMPRHIEVFIHTEIMRARPDVNAVIHTHPLYAVVFSSLGKPMQPVGHSGAIFFEDLPIFSETTDLIITPELGRSVAAVLGKSNAMLLQNHGIVSVGKTLEEAIFFATHLELACQMQLLAENAGGARALSKTDDARTKAALMRNEPAYVNVFNYLARKSECRSQGCS
jgi:L-ribulose-5-phosphate 4-epimerase